ncbi:hypothetical protein WICMUC_004888 [Wickerhamomyces mucosus]|uniref:Protein fyv10 n=1 Tax=Wickerhamomyces mucosus TaxID=1378264 RepID=A0A9P8PFK8_9ASCO|nr:hypothetical protein WICMUC_004888 [Wickerhamomyces mucosus]
MSLLGGPSLDFHLKLQESSFRVPYEAIRRNFRTIQKLDERELKKIEEIKKSLKKSKTKEEKDKVKKQLLISLRSFEKKLKARKATEDELISRINCRISKLKELDELQKSANLIKSSTEEVGEITKDKVLNWYRDQTNLLIIGYLLKTNLSIDEEQNLGLKLLKSLKVERLIDYDIILISNRISNSILRGNLTELVAWMNENKSYLGKIKSDLEFQTRLQEYIELIRDQDMKRAVSTFNNHLKSFSKTKFDEIQIASGLLIFNPLSIKEMLNKHKKKDGFKNNLVSKTFKKYSDLFSNERYEYLSKLFLQIYYKMNGIPDNDPLLVYLSLGISSLKTKACQCSSSREILPFETVLNAKLNKEDIPSPQSISKCPVCSMEVNQLSYELPYSHNERSYLFDNPVMLPNGNIFDKTKLLSFAKLKHPDVFNENKLLDPITSEVFDINQLVIMFPT